jgi:L-threonylcarbamoyladenylate synthase
MKYKHYAPKADMIIVEGSEDAVVDKINALVRQQKQKGVSAAVIAAEETKDRYRADVVLSIGHRREEDEIARHLYRILRECDECNVGAIYSESFQTPRIGNAIMNRLLKAAGHQVIQV